MADKVIQVPGVGNVAFPDTMSDDDISAAIGQMPQFKSSVASGLQKTAPQPGFLQRLGQSLGIPTSQKELAQSASDVPLDPGAVAAKLITNYARTAYQGAKEGFGDAYQAGKDYAQGGVSFKDTTGRLGYDALHTILQSTPFVGPSIDTAGQDIAHKNYAGGAGGLTGVIGQIALARAGGGETKPTTIPDAARIITDAVNPAPKTMTNFEGSVRQHLPDVLQTAKEQKLSLSNRGELAQAFTAAANKQKAAYNQMLEPVRGQTIDTSGIRGYQGGTTYYNTATLGQLDARLTEINATLNGAYQKGGGAARAALSGESLSALNAEAAAIRSRLYQEIGKRSGIDPQDVAATRGKMGAMFDVADKIQTSLNKERFSANQAAAGANPPHGAVDLTYRVLNKGYRKFLNNPDSKVSNAVSSLDMGGNQ